MNIMSLVSNSWFVSTVWRRGWEDHGARAALLVVALALVGASLLARLAEALRELRSLPPGPWGAPFVGYLPFMGAAKHTQYLQLARKYGGVFSARLGNQLTVVMSDYRLIRDTFRKEEFTGRPNTPLMKVLEGLGIVNCAGAMWKNQRKFLHEKLRQFGLTFMGNGKQIMEEKIQVEVTDFLEAIECVRGEPVDLNPLLAISVSNVICGIIMSVKFSKNDARLRRFNELIAEGMRLFGELHYAEYIPQYQYLPGKAEARRKIENNRNEMFNFFQEVIDQHKANFDHNNIRDLVDTYLVEIQKAKDEGREDELFGGKGEQQIKQICADLFSAGMETIKSTILWIIVFMLRNPDALRNVREELDRVVGRGRMPRMDDLPNLPITESTILETLRISSIVPLATTHSATRDVELNGYKIPAGTQVIPLLNCVHMDPNLWDKPEEFNPKRFMDQAGKVHKPEYFMPFGIGRRMCLGDILARMELFMFFSNIVHSYDITRPEGQPMPSLDGVVGATISPASFKVCLTQRPLEMPQIHNLLDGPNIRNVGSH